MSEQTKKTISKKLRLKAWFRYQFANQMSFSYDRAYVNGWTYGVLNVLRYLYDDAEKLKAALLRTRDYFLCEQTFGSAVLGIYLSMEEAYANGAEYDPDLIRQIKSSLMGPMSGIGDSLMGATIRQICNLFFLSLALEGKPLAAIGYAVVYLTISTVIALPIFQSGYKLGKEAIVNMLGNGILAAVTKAASIMAVFIIGAMCAKYTTFSLDFVYETNGNMVNIQETLDAAIPGMIPLAAAFIYYALVKKKVNYLLIILGTLALMIALYFLGLY